MYEIVDGIDEYRLLQPKIHFIPFELENLNEKVVTNRCEPFDTNIIFVLPASWNVAIEV